MEGAAAVERGGALEEPTAVVVGCADGIGAGVGDRDTAECAATEDTTETVGDVMKDEDCSAILGPDRGGRRCPLWYDPVKPLLGLCAP